MPTGYTASIANDISFQDFVLTCARAFGACVTLRDEELGPNIPEFEVSNYHLEQLEKYLAERLSLLTLKPEEVEAKALQQYLDEKESKEVSKRENIALRLKYEAMLENVRNWQPPTSEHVALRNFMINQIDESIRFDCNPVFYDKPTILLTSQEWMRQRLEKVDWNIEYHSKSHAEEVERVRTRNEWVRALRESLENK